MRMTLVGQNKGKTMKIHGVAFDKGVGEIPDDAGALRNILSNFHDAYADSDLEEVDGELVQRVVAPVASEVTQPSPVHTIGASGVPANEEVEELDEAGGAKEPSANTRPAGRRR